MSLLTEQALITEAMEKAGNTGLAVRLQAFLPLLLDNLYSRWPWPFLTKRVALPISAGTSSIDFSAGGSPLAGYRVYDVERCELALNGNFIDDMALQGPQEVAGFRDPKIQTGTGRARPQTLIADPSNPDAVKFDMFPAADQAYTLLFVIHAAPIAQFTYGDNLKPLYPNDLTLIEGMVAYVMAHGGDEREFALDQRLVAMVTGDIAKFGNVSGQNNKWLLNKKTFGQPAKRYVNRWGWMGP